MARPREFERDEVLRIAMELFWDKGYHATSISDLTEAMGVLRGSLYKAFRDKHSLFIESLKTYSTLTLAQLKEIIHSASDPLEGLHKCLDRVAGVTDKKNARRGCFMINSSLELVPEDRTVTTVTNQHYDQVEAIFTEAIDNARKSGQLRKDLDSSAGANTILHWAMGSCVVAKTKSGKERVNHSLTHMRRMLEGPRRVKE